MTAALFELDQDDEQRPEPTEWDIVEARLIRLGHLTIEGIGRRAQPRFCPTCRARILAGLDDDKAALRADVDPSPVTALGEMLAQLEGRRTYALVHNFGRLVLDYRDAGRIAYRPAGSGRLDVLAEHRCWSKTRLPVAASNLTRSHRLQNLTEGAPCPF